MKTEPLGGRILVEIMGKQEEEKVSQSGIVLPTSVDSKQQVHAMVAAIGKDCRFLKVGDHVIFRAPRSDEGVVQEDGKNFLLVDEENIWARINQ